VTGSGRGRGSPVVRLALPVGGSPGPGVVGGQVRSVSAERGA
jgi:hypothetical protein